MISMSRTFKTFLTGLIAVSSILCANTVMFTRTAYAAVDAKQAVCEGAGAVDPASGGCSSTSSTAVEKVLSTGLNLFSAIIGIIAVVMIMIAGLKYITSQGEPANIATAKNSIIYAAIGLVVVALAQVIVRFVLYRFS